MSQILIFAELKRMRLVFLDVRCCCLVYVSDDISAFNDARRDVIDVT